MAYWLLKSEPDEFSIDQLRERGQEEWGGVRNYQARNHLRSMQPGESFFFYHSSCAVPGIYGIGKILRTAAADPTQFDPAGDYFDPKSDPLEPRWSSVLTGYVRHTRVITLNQLRDSAAQLQDFILLNRGNRLSVLPVTQAQWQAILALEAKTA